MHSNHASRTPNEALLTERLQIMYNEASVCAGQGMDDVRREARTLHTLSSAHACLVIIITSHGPTIGRFLHNGTLV